MGVLVPLSLSCSTPCSLSRDHVSPCPPSCQLTERKAPSRNPPASFVSLSLCFCWCRSFPSSRALADFSIVDGFVFALYKLKRFLVTKNRDKGYPDVYNVARAIFQYLFDYAFTLLVKFYAKSQIQGATVSFITPAG